MKDEFIKKFYKEICENFEGDYKIILEPPRELNEDWIEYDQVKWEMEEPIKNLVNKLLKDNSISFEEKLLSVYKFICLNYIYDVNVLYFFKRDTSDINNIKYIAVDWYGRIVGQKWIENRKKQLSINMIQYLNNIDISKITPLDALNLLADLKEMLYYEQK